MSDLQKQIEERIKKVLSGRKLGVPEIEWLESLNVSDYVSKKQLVQEKCKAYNRGHKIATEVANRLNKNLKSDYVKKEDLKPAHKCKKIATCDMAENRDWWLGELTETIKEYPQETHCLHLKTPAKDIVFLCNSGDFSNLAVFAEIALGYKINSDWMKSTIDRYLVK